MADDLERPGPAPFPAPPASAGAAVRARVVEALAFNRREVAALAVLGLLLVAGAGIGVLRSRPSAATAAVPLAAPSAMVEATVDPAVLVVSIVGAVKDPGVYRLDAGARVIDAVRAAGGLGRFADVVAVNLARPLTDGEQIVVPRRARRTDPVPQASGGAPDAGGLININTATAAELETLPGIGPVLAQRIVDHREANGPFARIEDLQQVSGIGPKTFESIAPHVTV